ncbi:hypothetical protein KBC03_07170 [Patescibacteria group bacterium]|nr:hypothetical protein [Patescibacteria group bacterium]
MGPNGIPLPSSTWIKTDKNILTNYDDFPSLKGKENNENKKKFVDYLNKSFYIKDAPAAK